MSRIGRLPIAVPAGVTVNIKDNQVSVKGPKGEISQTFVPAMTIKLQDSKLVVERPNDTKENRALHGLTRSLIKQYGNRRNKGLGKKLGNSWGGLPR